MSDLAKPGQKERSFPVTRWSLVSRVRGEDDEAKAIALSELCEAYWYPVYSFLRRQGANKVEAQDQTQAFFAMILRRNDFAKADSQRGRLRSFLLKALRNFRYDEFVRGRAQKRGGDVAIVSFDVIEAERRFSAEPSSSDDMETYYQKQWALVILERALDRLRSEQDGGRAEAFETLRPLLTRPDGVEEAAEKLNCTVGALRVRLHRMRKRLKLLVEEEIMDTVESEEEFDDEYVVFRKALGA